MKVKAQRCIDEVKGYGDDMLAGVITSPASEVAGNGHPSAGNLYCVVDLSAGPSATNYPVSYLAVEPKGGWTDEYKTTKLVLRRIEPGKFMMGGKYEVTLTKPFYCGVFEVTQKQYALVTGGNPSYAKGDMRPVERVTWNAIRGNSATYNWPSSANGLERQLRLVEPRLQFARPRHVRQRPPRRAYSSPCPRIRQIAEFLL